MGHKVFKQGGFYELPYFPFMVVRLVLKVFIGLNVVPAPRETKARWGVLSFMVAACSLIGWGTDGKSFGFLSSAAK